MMKGLTEMYYMTPGIKEKIDLYGFDNHAWGLRGLSEDEDYADGEPMRNSYDWDFENDCSAYASTGMELPGTCTVGICDDTEEALKEALDRVSWYGWGTFALVCGSTQREGDDIGESIIFDPVCVMSWEGRF